MYPQPIEKTLRLYADAGVSSTELFVNTCSEISASFIRRYRAILKGSETRIISVHPFTSSIEGLLLFSEYKRRFAEGLEFYKRYFHFAAEVGAKFIVLHGCLQPPGVPEEIYWERYDRLHRQAVSQGVRLAQENVARYMSGSLDMLRRLKENIPDVCFVLDIKQAIRCGYNPFEVMDVMKERIVHLHISDNSDKSDCLPPGKGNFDFGKLVNNLQVLNKDFFPVIELYRDNYSTFQELLNSYKLLRNLQP